MTRKLKVEGMMCKHCVAHVKKALEEIAGVAADVDLDSGMVTVSAAQPVEDAALIKAVVDAGYEAKIAE